MSGWSGPRFSRVCAPRNGSLPTHLHHPGKVPPHFFVRLRSAGELEAQAGVPNVVLCALPCPDTWRCLSMTTVPWNPLKQASDSPPAEHIIDLGILAQS